MMSRKLAWTSWALAPVAFIAWSFGPGAESRALEQAAGHLARAQQAQQAERWEEAREAFSAALAALPEGSNSARARLALEHADATLAAGELWAAVEGYEALLGELEPAGAPLDTDGVLDAEGARLARETRHQLASARYFAAWLMRLEGGSDSEWRPEAQKARQHFALLASRAREADLPEALDFEKNVEAVVRLELMDLDELVALPLPKNCPNCTSGLCKGKKKCAGGNCKGGQKPADAREKLLQQGAGNLRASGSGS